MAQQQPRRERQEFGNAQRDYDVRDRNVRKNDDEMDRWKDEFGSRATADPVASYAYGNIGSGGYGAPPTGGPYAGADYGASGFEYSTAYGTTGAAPGYGVPPGGAVQRGREGNVDRGGDDGGMNMDMNNVNMDRDMDNMNNMNMGRNRNMNMGRDRK